nr:F-box protein PP2-A12-like [Ipomoea batatas]
MGSSLSFLVEQDGGACPEGVAASTGLGDLPESCVALVLAHLDPKQICRLAMLNRAFRGASFADFVWESKLPVDYWGLVRRVFRDENFPGNLCKRDIFARLCTPNSIDGGTKVVWLDKSTGRVCLSIASNGLAITGIDDRRYWSRIPTEESRFHSVAYLQQIWWFEVDGEVEFPFPAGSYAVFFRLHLGRASKRFYGRVCNSEHVHGWDKKPVRFQLSSSDGQQATTECYLSEAGKWVYQHAGDFVVSDSGKTMKLRVSMTQIDCTHTKGGLCVDSLLVCPAEYKPRLKRL